MSHSEKNSVTTVKRTLRRKIEIPTFTDTDDVSMNRYQVYRGLSPDTSNRLEMKIKTLEETLESEKQSKITVEQEIGMLVEELQLQTEHNEELNKRLSDQTSVARLKEQEFMRLKKEFESLLEENEGNESLMKKKFQEVVNDFSGQMESLNKQKNRVELDKRKLIMEVSEGTSQLESQQAFKRQLESRIDSLENETKRLRIESEEKSRQFHDTQESKAKLVHDHSEVVSKLRNMETTFDGTSREKTKLIQEIESLRMALEEAESFKPQLVSSIGVLQNDLQIAKSDLEDECQSKELLQSQILKLQTDLTAQKMAFEKDLALQMQDSEVHRKKVLSQVADADSQMNQQVKRSAKLEKDNSRLNTDLKELYEDLAMHKGQITEVLKKLKSQENYSSDQRNQIDQLNISIESKVESEDRLHGEISKLKMAVKSITEDQDKSTRDQKLLNDALKEVREELNESRRQHDSLAGHKSNSDKEVLRLTGKIGEGERKVCDKENELYVLSNEMKSVKEDMKAGLGMKDEEIDRLKRAQEKLGEEGLRRVDEEQARHKTEVGRARKAFEVELVQLQSSQDTANRQNSELNRSNKGLNNRIKELESVGAGLEGVVEDVRGQLVAVERRRAAMDAQLDHLQCKLDSSEMSRRNMDLSLQECMQQNEYLTNQLTTSHSDHKKSESELLALKFLTDEFGNSKRDLDEILEKQKHEIEHLNEALAFEMERSSQGERVVQDLERRLRESRAMMEELEGKILKEERKMTAKMAARCQGIEVELEGEQKKVKDLSAEVRKLTKQTQELTFERDSEMTEREEKEHSLEGCNFMISKLKKNLMESEEVIALVTTKYKRIQHQFNETAADKEQLEAAASNHSSRASSHINVKLPTSSRLSIARSLRFAD